MMVRLASAADADEVLALIRAMPELPQWSREALAVPRAVDHLADEPFRRLIVAEDGDEVVGFAQFSVLLGEAELESIAVERGSQRRGAGRLLLEFAMGSAREHGAMVFRLEVRKGNEAALRLYQAAGFCVTGTRRRYYANPVEDAVMLQLSWA